MSAIVFDGVEAARKYEVQVRDRVRLLPKRPRILSVVFEEDAGSQLYTRLKFEAAARVGIDFDRMDFRFGDNLDQMQEQIQYACARQDVDGVMIQKPSKLKWNTVMRTHGRGKFADWWQALTMCICLHKDVDCLTRQHLDMVYAGEWQMLPATVRGVLLILEEALGVREGILSSHEPWLEATSETKPLQGKRVAVVGRSDIVGKPLAAVLSQKGAVVQVCGSKTEDLGMITAAAEIVVSATGVAHLLKEDLIHPGAVVIDVGSPKPDVDFEAVKEEVAFITPVPYGVGPMTVVSLLMNQVDLMVR